VVFFVRGTVRWRNIGLRPGEVVPKGGNRTQYLGATLSNRNSAAPPCRSKRRGLSAGFGFRLGLLQADSRPLSPVNRPPVTVTSVLRSTLCCAPARPLGGARGAGADVRGCGRVRCAGARHRGAPSPSRWGARAGWGVPRESPAYCASMCAHPGPRERCGQNVMASRDGGPRFVGSSVQRSTEVIKRRGVL
jgi:hypothetical protein